MKTDIFSRWKNNLMSSVSSVQSTTYSLLPLGCYPVDERVMQGLNPEMLYVPPVQGVYSVQNVHRSRMNHMTSLAPTMHCGPRGMVRSPVVQKMTSGHSAQLRRRNRRTLSAQRQHKLEADVEAPATISTYLNPHLDRTDGLLHSRLLVR